MAQRQRFTLIELIVILSVFSVLSMMLITALKMAKDRSKEIGCKDKLMTIGVAVGEFTYDNQMDIPEGDSINQWSFDRHWIPELAPYLGFMDMLYPQAKYSEAFWYRRECGDGTARLGAPSILQCPSEEGNRGTEYGFNWKYMRSLGSGDDRTRKKLKYGMVHYWRDPRGVAPAKIEEQVIIGDNRGKNSQSMGKPYAPETVAVRHRMGGNYLFYDFHVEWKSFEFTTNESESHWTFWRAVANP